MVKEKEKVIPMHSVNILNNHTLEVIRAHHNRRITTIEKILGAGNAKRGARIIKKLLAKLSSKGFSSQAIGKILGKDRHVIHDWLRRYELEPLPIKGAKPSLLKITFVREGHDVNFGRYEKINGKFYRVFYVYPTQLFAYMIGLILGDGNVDDRKIHITGGKPFHFLDSIFPKTVEFGKYLGGRSIKVKYFNEEDNELSREHPNVTYWRLYIYWSALSRLLNNKKFLKGTLERIWSSQRLLKPFMAGFFDADGYFTKKHEKPVRIGFEQTKDKWWFPLLCNKLKSMYSVWASERTRDYEIEQRGKVYTGTATFNIAILRMSSWVPFIDEIVIPFCRKPIHRRRAPIFKDHALNVKDKWKLVPQNDDAND